MSRENAHVTPSGEEGKKLVDQIRVSALWGVFFFYYFVNYDSVRIKEAMKNSHFCYMC